MGQNNSKHPNNSSSQSANDSSSSSATSPSLGGKIKHLFSSSKPNNPNDQSSALSSPLPPSSSALAKAFRKELADSPAPEEKKVGSSFFLGKMLISPRRPLREYKMKTFHPKKSNLVIAAEQEGVDEEGVEAEALNQPNDTLALNSPKPLKRKARSPSGGSRSKMMRVDVNTASPVLKKSNIPAIFDVEEQDDESDDDVAVDALEEELKRANKQSTSITNGTNPVNEVQCEADTLNIEKNRSAKEDEMIDAIDEPYSPSSSPKNMHSVMDISAPNVMDEEPTIINEKDVPSFCEMTVSDTVSIDSSLLNESIAAAKDAIEPIEKSAPQTNKVTNGESDVTVEDASSKKENSSEDSEFDTNSLPSANTTNSSSMSKKLMSALYQTTDSKPNKEDSKAEEKMEEDVSTDANSRDKPFEFGIPASENEFYHHAPSNSTYSSTTSRSRFETRSYLPISSSMTLPIVNFEFFKNLWAKPTQSDVIETSALSDGVGMTVPNINDNKVSKDDEIIEEKDEAKKDEMKSSSSIEVDELKLTDSEAENSSCQSAAESAAVLNGDDTKSHEVETEKENGCEFETASAVTNSDATPELPSDSDNASNIDDDASNFTPKRSRRLASKKQLKVLTPIKKGNIDSPRSGRKRPVVDSSEMKIDEDDEGCPETHKRLKVTMKKLEESDSESTTSSATCSAGGVSEKLELTEEFAAIDDDNSIEFIKKNEFVIIVRTRGNAKTTSDFLKRAVAAYPEAKVITLHQTGKTKRKHRVQQCLSELQDAIDEHLRPIIVEVNKGSQAESIFLDAAHTANYNSIVIDECPSAKDPMLLPYCYSWFLTHSDSEQLDSIGRKLFLNGFQLSNFAEDISIRTGKIGSPKEIVSSYTPNNVVGGPNILHCTAKGSSRNDPEYCMTPAVQHSLGKKTTLQVVGYVITPRTIGARVKLTEDQLTLWGNSDNPDIPLEIKEMFENQEKLCTDNGKESDTHAGIDCIDNGGDHSVANGTFDVAACDQFKPVKGVGCRAHITLGCSSDNIHPRTTGYDVLLAVQEEEKSKPVSSHSVKCDELGTAQYVNYGNGVWVVYPQEMVTVGAVFSGFHYKEQ